MLELPGLHSTNDPKKDLDAVRRYLSRLVPQLERELEDLGVDGFGEAMASRTEGLVEKTGAANQTSTSAAVAEHLLDTDNPHKVTLEQLKPVQAGQTGDGWWLNICGVLIQCVWTELEAAEGEAAGAVYFRDIDCGEWPVSFNSIAHAVRTLEAEELSDVWAGCATEADEESAGTMRIYSTAAEMPACTIIAIGIGG